MLLLVMILGRGRGWLVGGNDVAEGPSFFCFLSFCFFVFQHLVMFILLFQLAWNHRRSLYSSPPSRLSDNFFAPDFIDKSKAQYKSQQSVARKLYCLNLLEVGKTGLARTESCMFDSMSINL